jgi:DoxX-like family
MTPTSATTEAPAHSMDKTKRLHTIALGLFCALFLGSVVFGLADIDGSKAEWIHLGFPWWSFYALTAGKALGVAAILWNKSKSLKQLAFAGFLYDLLLATGAHLAVPEFKVVLPIVCLALWGFAYVMDQRRYP